MLRNQWANKQLISVTEKLSAALRRPVVWAPPRHIAAEVTNFCNLRCRMCKWGQRVLERDKGFMDYDKFCKLIDEISPNVRRISFPWYGEPFTRDDFGRFVRHASGRGMTIHIQTNGTFLHKCELDYLTECNVRSVSVAIDGLEQETYEAYRVGGNLAEVVDGVKRLVTLRRERGGRYPERIEMNYLVMKHNEHELPRVREYGRNLGFDRVKIKSPHVDRTEEGRKLLPTDPQYRRYEDGFLLKSGRDRKPGCRDLWRSAVISWQGAMGLCCMDSDCEHSPGNVFDEGFFPVWFGRKMQAWRRAVLKNKAGIPLCKDCHRG